MGDGFFKKSVLMMLLLKLASYHQVLLCNPSSELEEFEVKQSTYFVFPKLKNVYII